MVAFLKLRQKNYDIKNTTFSLLVQKVAIASTTIILPQLIIKLKLKCLIR